MRRKPFIAVFAVLAIQSTAAAQAPAAAAQAPLKVLNLADYGRWSRITSTGLSADGKWMSYAYQPNEGDGTLHVKQLDGDKVFTIPIGAAPAAAGGGGGAPGGGGAVQFSDDSRFVAYYVNPPDAGGGRGGRGGGGGRGGAPPAQGARGGAAPAAAGGAVRRLEVLSLQTGDKFPVANASSFRFSKGSKWIAIRLNKSVPTATNDGADLIVRDLASGSTRNIGNVGQYDFDATGALLAYTVDAAERLGNGVYVDDLASGGTRALSTAAMDYSQLTWSDEGSNLAVLRGDKVKDYRQKANTLLAWTAITPTNATKLEWDPAADASFPRGHVLSEFSALRFSKDGSTLFAGIKEQEMEIPASDSIKANVDVWHWKDAETQATQILRVAQERRATYTASIQIASKKFTRLADTAMRTVTPTADSKWVIGSDELPYRADRNNTQRRADYYRVNAATGERTVIEKNLTRTYGASPDSKWFLYMKDSHIRAFNLELGKSTELAANAGRALINDDDDHAADKALRGVAGWSSDGKSVLLNGKYDVWQVPLDGAAATRFTGTAGDAQQIVLRVVRLGAGGRGGRGGGGGGGGGRGGAVGDDTGIDLSKPVMFSAYGELTKKSGYWQVAPGQAAKPLIWADKEIAGVQKAENADRVMFTQQTFNEFPDFWVSDAAFTSPKKITDANPILKEYAWGSKVLIDYTNSKGKKLQGTLTLPAGYQPGKKYPMLVYFYEIMSNTHHTFSMPTFDDRPQMSTYASNGYMVFQPDVVYEIGKPGSSALDCVTSGVKKVISLGYADPKHIGLQGHSWGGYESSYIVTQTDMFAAVVTGAPLTDLVSMYGEIYKQTGDWNGGILETSQGRMGDNVTPWNAKDLYESQSPLFNVTKIKTPFMILQGTADGAVDWDQGLEFFNAARRNGKEVIFLSYPNEPHHLAIKENQKDFQTRMKQYFDHYLMDVPAPMWMTDGVPQTKKGGPIQTVLPKP